MSGWMGFLNSLSTRGGAIFMLVLINFVGVGVTMHLIHHGEAAGALGASLMTGFSNFQGALLMALKGSSDSTASVTSNSTGTTAQVSTASDSAKITTPATETSPKVP